MSEQNAMNPFVYMNPTVLFYGKGMTQQLSKAIPKDAKVMMIYGGGSIKRNGVYDEVLKYVKPTIEFGGIEPNPAHETCMKAVKVAKENGITFFLAIGGGSVIDATKYIALAMEWTESEDPFEMFTKGIKNPAKIPIGTVLTIPATGTESNPLFVITKYATKQKSFMGHESVYPKFSVVDPTHSFSLPKNQVINGVVDSYVHCIEQYIGHYDKAAIPDRQAEAVLKTIVETGPKTIAEPTNYKYRADFCYAATIALNRSLATGVEECWGAHEIGHDLTAYYGVAHGESLAMACPSVMRFNKEKNAKKLAQLAHNVFGIENATAQDGIDCTVNFFKSVGAKLKLSEYGFGPEHFETIAKRFEESPKGRWKDIDGKGCLTILNDLLK